MPEQSIPYVEAAFVSEAICEWGQPEQERIDAVQAVLKAAKFKAKATCWPVFGGIWPKPCKGKDAADATTWLNHLTDTMKRGRFEWERDHVVAAIESRINDA